ncbi:MAG: ABC transporter permease [Actinomycetota bacterium]|nr:ABC transporter permease [Actinomycetota bacterium]
MTAAHTKSRLAFRDLVGEATTSLLIRPGRTMLTILGTVLGVGALVATLGVARTAGNQIATHFDALTATSITVNERSEGWGWYGPPELVGLLPWDAEDRLMRLNGVVAAGTMSTVKLEGASTRSVPIHDPIGRSEYSISMVSVSPGLFDTVGADLRTGRIFDEHHSSRSDPVTVLGPAAAQRLNIDRVDHQPAIFVGDTTLIVVGILDDVQREPRLLDAVIVPDGTAQALFGLEGVEQVLIRTEVGATELIASQAATALYPNDPGRLYVAAPTAPAATKSAIAEDVNALFLVLGGVSLLIGAIGIANVTLVSVLERVGEIGLRRAVGAARRHVAWQFLIESAAMGLIGGVIGASIGVLVIVGVSAARLWTPVLDPIVPLAAPALGAAIGLIAGLYPSWRAASLEPVDALRAGV